MTANLFNCLAIVHAAVLLTLAAVFGSADEFSQKDAPSAAFVLSQTNTAFDLISLETQQVVSR